MDIQEDMVTPQTQQTTAPSLDTYRTLSRKGRVTRTLQDRELQDDFTRNGCNQTDYAQCGQGLLDIYMCRAINIYVYLLIASISIDLSRVCQG